MVSDERDQAFFPIHGQGPGLVQHGKQVGGGQVLGGKHAVDGLQRKLAPMVQEIGEVGLAKAGLTGQQRDAERAPPDPAQQFQAESLVHLRKIYLWKIHHRQWERTVRVCSWKS
jgi:hypothetical protein